MKKLLVVSLILCLVLGAAIVLPLPRWAVYALAERHAALFLADQGQDKAMTLYDRFVEIKIKQSLSAQLFAPYQGASDAETLTGFSNDIRSLTFNQLELNLPLLSGSAARHLLRGFGTCDQTNGFLAYSLSKRFADTTLFSLYNGQFSPHTLVRVQSEQLGTVYVDSWVDIAPFSLETGQTFPALSQIKESQARAYAGTEMATMTRSHFDQGFVLNEYSTVYQIKKAVNIILSKLWPQAFEAARPAPVNSNYTAAAPIVKPQESKEKAAPVWGPDSLKPLYIRARLDHLYGDLNAARAGYAEVAAANCDSDFCILSQAFLTKLQAAPAPAS